MRSQLIISAGAVFLNIFRSTCTSCTVKFQLEAHGALCPVTPSKVRCRLCEGALPSTHKRTHTPTH